MEDLAENCAVIFSMLADDAAVRSVFAAVLQGGPPHGAVFADMSTVLPSTTAELAALAAEKGALRCSNQMQQSDLELLAGWTHHVAHSLTAEC